MWHTALSFVTREGCPPPEFVNEDPMGRASRSKKIPQSFVSTLPASLSNLPFAPGCNPYGKISASLIDLIDPYADEDLPLDTMRKLVGMGVVAWNIASTSNTLDEATAELDRFIRDTPALGASAGTAAEDFRVAVLARFCRNNECVVRKVRYGEDCLYSQRVKLLGGSLREATVFHLAFDDHVHELDAAQNDACTTKTLEAQHRSGATLDGTMVLLHDVVQVLLLADPDRRLTFSVERL
jgi:hypothetical protein